VAAAKEFQAELAQAREELSAYKCPQCGAPMVTTGPVELDEYTEDTVEVFACGHSTGGWSETPCPSDPRFPKVDEFEFKIIKSEEDRGIRYVCIALAKTDMARRVDLNQGVGRTEEEARQMVIEHYNRRAKRWRH
jgi:hypothetical protein